MRRQQTRIAVAIAVGTIATFFPYAEHLRPHGRPSDFGVVWFGSRSLLRGIDPYPLVGPGLPFERDFNLNYPATSMVAALPLGLLPELVATLIFVFCSAALLTYGLTEKGWDRLWILPSAAFVVACRAAQWSPLYSAAYLIPSLGWMLASKPTLGFAVAVARPSPRLFRTAFAGTALLLVVSLIMLPGWPREWLHNMQTNEFPPAVTWLGGPLILLSLFRWRTPEGRLLAAMACVPTTASWYEALPLLLVGRTKRECQALSMASSIGYILQGAFISSDGFVEVEHTRRLMVAFCYLPAVLVTLRRPMPGID